MKAAFGAILQRKVKNINSLCVDLAENCKRKRKKWKNFITRLSNVFFFLIDLDVDGQDKINNFDIFLILELK